MAILGSTGGKVVKRRRQTQLQQNADPKTTGNAVTGTSPYTTPTSSSRLYSVPVHSNPRPNQAGPHNANHLAPIGGKWANGAKGKWERGAIGKWKRNDNKGHGGGGGGAGATPEPNDKEDVLHGSAETGTTGFAHQYSKSPYRTSQFAMGPGKMEFGKSGTGKKKPAEAKPRKAPAQGKRKGRKAK